MITIAVCVKQIPNPNFEQAFDTTSKTLVRPTPLVLDEADTFGIEIGLQLAEQAGGGEITAISIAPEGEVDGIRSAYAIGAHRGVLVSDPSLAGLDALGTAKVLARVALRTKADLVLTATESTDGYTGTVPVQIAQLLDYPGVSHARSVVLEAGALKIQRQTEVGTEIIHCPLPAVVSVTSGLVDVRYPSFKAKTLAKSRPIEHWTLDDLGIAPSEVGWLGARQEILQIEERARPTGGGSLFAAVFGSVEAAKGGTTIADEGDAERMIIDALQGWNAI